MQYSHGRDHKINLGGQTYENISISSHWSITHTDLGYTDEEWAEHVRDVGVQAAAEELSEVVHDLTIHELSKDFVENEPYIVEPENSFVPLWLDDHAEPPKKKRGS